MGDSSPSIERRCKICVRCCVRSKQKTNGAFSVHTVSSPARLMHHLVLKLRIRLVATISRPTTVSEWPLIGIIVGCVALFSVLGFFLVKNDMIGNPFNSISESLERRRKKRQSLKLNDTSLTRRSRSSTWTSGAALKRTIAPDLRRRWARATATSLASLQCRSR